MTVDLPLRCSCGSVTGRVTGVSPTTVNHIVCYCTDCRAYLEHLGATSALDGHGGTHIVQMSIGAIHFDQGLEHVAAMQLRPDGMMRWHTSCCNSPIANTLGPSVPFAGVIHGILDADLTAAAGPPVRVMGRSATGDVATLQAYKTHSPRNLLRVMRLLAGWWWRGDAKRSPFHVDGRPRVAPRPPPVEAVDHEPR